MTLLEKIKQALEQDTVCVLSQKGKKQYVVLIWERYQELMSNTNIQEKINADKEKKIIYSTNIDINDIPV
jgi:hypothetical protein